MRRGRSGSQQLLLPHRQQIPAPTTTYYRFHSVLTRPPRSATGNRSYRLRSRGHSQRSPMTAILLEGWAPRGPLFALAGVLLTIAALGWEPALRALTTPEEAPSRFLFQPKVIHPALLLRILLLSGGLLLFIAALRARGWLLLATPLLRVGVGRGTLLFAGCGYRRRLHMQLLLAVEQLAALTGGSAAILTAFRSVGRAAAPPLRDEWTWVERHISVPYVADEHGPLRHSDHAYAL